MVLLAALWLAALPARAGWEQDAGAALRGVPAPAVNQRTARRAVMPRGWTACSLWFAEAEPPRVPDPARDRAEALLGSLIARLAAASAIPLDNVCPARLIRNDQFYASYQEFLNRAHELAASFVLTSGTLAKVASDDELAAVLAHELAHRRLDHQGKAFDERGLVRLDSERRRVAMERELDADALGATLLARAGYDPAAASRPLRWVEEDEKKPSLFPDFAHPPAAERRAALDAVAKAGPFDGKPRTAPLRVLAELRALGF